MMWTHIDKPDLLAARTVLNPSTENLHAYSCLYCPHIPKQQKKAQKINMWIEDTPLLILKNCPNTHIDVFFYLNPFFALTSAPETEYHKLPSHTYRQHFTAFNLSYTETLHASFLAHSHSPLTLATRKSWSTWKNKSFWKNRILNPDHQKGFSPGS